MLLGAIPQNPIEWLALKTGMVPTPLGHSHIGFILSRSLLEATDLGIFEALKEDPRDTESLATACNLHPKALTSLLNLMASCNYLDYKNDTWLLTGLSRKWLLKDSPHSVRDLLLLDNRVCWKWMDHLRTFLQTGKGLGFHEILTEEEWIIYQHAMAAAARAQSTEVGSRTPVPKGATQMLDIGGSHGLHSVALCKKHKQLHATIFDLPEAIKTAQDILAKEKMGDRVRHQAGNILNDPLESEHYDMALMASLAHHFSQEENRLIAKKVLAALKPGGYYIILDFICPSPGKNSEMVGTSNDLFFALSSTAGTYKTPEMKDWLQATGFTRVKTKKMLTLPGYTQVIGQKPEG